MEPKLTSVRLDSLTDTSSIVEIVYQGSPDLKGVELMGVDAGLSWLKGKSIMLSRTPSETEDVLFSVMINVTDRCEFRARGYDAEEDHWEDGMGNHRMIRNDNGSIKLETERDSDMFFFKGSVPLNFSPSLEDAFVRIENVRVEQPSLFQLLVDLSVWIDTLMDNPFEGTKIRPLPYLVTYLKVQSRALDSKKVDEVVRPIMKSLYYMQRSAMDFSMEDVRLLTGEWEQEGIIAGIKALPEKVKELENTPNLGRGRDSFDRFRELLKYVS